MMNHDESWTTLRDHVHQGVTKGLMDWSHARPRGPWRNFEKKQTNRHPNAWMLAHLSPLSSLSDCGTWKYPGLVLKYTQLTLWYFNVAIENDH